MNQIEQIEQRFGVKYPELYKRLYDDGMLDWGEYGPNWHATYWEKFKSNPPLLLFGDDIELLELNQIVEKIEELKDPEDYRATKPEFQFVPFAMTGGGDLYVFQFDQQCGENVPVTLVPHDSESASILAKNLQDFIFRKLLECVAEIDEYSSAAEGGDLKTNLFNMLRTHKPYLSQRQVAKIEEIYNRDLFDYKYNIPNGNELSLSGLISLDELEEVLHQEIGFENLDKEFVYMG
ncbi:SMI1/KNR4 family protein [Paenibacillus dendritiformis]|nr:SMI1/KNR4 family protein [Paenibacillus dendritiformis]